MDRYQRVAKPKPESPINENEIRITSKGLIRNYISYATSLLQEKSVKDIVLKAMGQAISKTVAISEILKNKIPGLHQDIAISSISITDVWEPTEEGLFPVELTRHVSMISITLSLSELNKDSPGYQAPAQSDQSKPQYQPQQGRQARLPYNAYGEEGEVVAEGEAGEEVDMETTKGVMKEKTKGTIKKIIKTMKVGIQTRAEAVDVVDEAMAIVILDIRVAEAGMVVGEMVDMVVGEMTGMGKGEMTGMGKGEMTGMVEEETTGMVEGEMTDMVEAETMDMGEEEADFVAVVVEAEMKDTVAAEVDMEVEVAAKVMGMAEAEVTGMVEAEVTGMVEAEVMAMVVAELIGMMEEDVMAMVEADMMAMVGVKVMVMEVAEADTVEVEADMVVDVEGWVMVVVQGMVLVTKTKPKLFHIPFSKLYGLAAAYFSVALKTLQILSTIPRGLICFKKGYG
ncbi:Alba DNA/RNA-binding protein [Arabidopsis thaliana]|uniref:Alba DNA/RNA-binding protein n=1 Tax=Arabidopsis thaliana TaxID=3702 RepID=A0A1I9LSC0_ARATH|nr:Alba DNA/RNA-binding protein [Arabidopsis thaliana]ANM65478.1 Alba DNA/RNA-binding protein [Arabidopsis thaliana]|eukprot:NP_001327441.1 Alba DNA/RNA-binding protein [Arabidopsis thaliana]